MILSVVRSNYFVCQSLFSRQSFSFQFSYKKQLSDNLFSLVSILPSTKGEVLLTCQKNKHLLMSRLLRTYKRYDHETLKLNINFFVTQINY